ncbi:MULTISPECIES: DUF4186 domain-containing protein [Serratia]|uniref:DUF4186 domain-containing protein n=2 Tax=Serratia marcescens TaxID=615 RepID=A0A349ZLG3_SERMA|nr:MULTISPECIES: DUF4186 domain-containing protein [Serratia]ASM17624.1 DUF4186 domain-containing protein [Serratia marcescens]EGT0450419.1 DUF4186 domain-containing protein [Serratia marcescens]ELA7783253.1 DUF4186 domain-containing protein [Serratia marcescens]KFD13789.1 hypothetical protein GSMA_02452 [Serratia marcescens subsp. marcescens ATCC 13880]MBH3012906.1 DUF4186 domain-containing protein [Serratia marcescens]
MMPFQPDVLWRRLQSSPFRARFRLNAKDQTYLEGKGLPLILSHARDFIDRRLAAAHPKNDGKQTPMRGHPVFVAQHATATCCRGCLEKWHDIAQGVALDEQQKDYIVQVIALWLVRRGGAGDVSGTNIFDPDRGL